MLVSQIASTLNALNQEMVGETALVLDDKLSNIVDVGKQVLDFTSGASGANYDNYMKNLIDQIGKVMFVDRVYRSQAPNILKDSWEYGSIMMKVRATMNSGKTSGVDANYGDGIPIAGDNTTWDLASISDGTGLATADGTASPLDPFVLTKPSVEAKFFNKKVTYEVAISLCREQLKEAFRSANEMARFFSMIENRIAMKRTLCTDALIMSTIRNLIGNKICTGKGINLLPLYNASLPAGSTPLTTTTCWVSPDFIRFCNKTISLYKKYMGEASTLYNEGNYVTFTPNDRMKAVFLAEYVKDAEVYLYSDAFHNEYDKLDGYSEVGYWQGTGASPDAGIDARGTISGKYITMDESTIIGGARGVIAVLFDEQACAVCCENDRVTSIYNPRGEYTNYFYKWDANFLNDLEENVMVFYVDDKEYSGVFTGNSAPSNWTTEYAKSGSKYYIWDTSTNDFRQLTANDAIDADDNPWTNYKDHIYYKAP
jgi:hypothetical protein